jgi:hypothetical protein
MKALNVRLLLPVTLIIVGFLLVAQAASAQTFTLPEQPPLDQTPEAQATLEQIRAVEARASERVCKTKQYKVKVKVKPRKKGQKPRYKTVTKRKRVCEPLPISDEEREDMEAALADALDELSFVLDMRSEEREEAYSEWEEERNAQLITPVEEAYEALQEAIEERYEQAREQLDADREAKEESARQAAEDIAAGKQAAFAANIAQYCKEMLGNPPPAAGKAPSKPKRPGRNASGARLKQYRQRLADYNKKRKAWERRRAAVREYNQAMSDCKDTSGRDAADKWLDTVLEGIADDYDKRLEALERERDTNLREAEKKYQRELRVAEKQFRKEQRAAQRAMDKAARADDRVYRKLQRRADNALARAFR